MEQCDLNYTCTSARKSFEAGSAIQIRLQNPVPIPSDKPTIKITNLFRDSFENKAPFQCCGSGSEIICKLVSGTESVIINFGSAFGLGFESASKSSSVSNYPVNKNKAVKMYRFLKISFFAKFR
jgi:hypothetical protein